MTFTDFSLSDSLSAAVEAMGFHEATPVQESVIPLLLEDRQDIVALAQTGTGKTAAFGLPVLEKLSERSLGRTSALVLCPTRELAIQTTGELQSYAAELPQITIDAIYGGAGYGNQIRALKGGVDVLVATPGRLLDLINRGKADLGMLRYLILDEADIMLNMGFKEELDAILETVPDERRTVLLSATMPADVARIAGKYMHEPETLTMGTKNAAAESVEHHYFQVHPRDKYPALKRLVDYHPEIYGIVFCRTKAATQEIAEKLIADGYGAEALHGDLSQAQREQVMRKFRNKSIRLIVATDIASRGLDVQELSHVIHYDLPDEIDIYTHRSGRTGRAGKNGTSYAIVGPREKHRLGHIERVIKRTIHPAEMPGGNDIFRRHLMDFAERLGETEVDRTQIEPHLAEMKELLGDLSRDELLEKIVSLRFEDMIGYYRNLPELKAAKSAPASSFKGNKSGGKNNFSRQNRNGKGKSRQNSGNRVEEGFESIRINLGKRDKVAPPDLIGLVNQSSRSRNIEIGRINIRPAWSTMQVDEDFAVSVAEALDGFTYRGRTLHAQVKAS